MRTKLKDFKLPETWHVKIQPNNYMVMNSWRRSRNFLPIYDYNFYLNQEGFFSKYKPCSTLITFPQFRKYVYPNIIPPIEKRVVSGIHNLGSGQYLKEVQEIANNLMESFSPAEYDFTQMKKHYDNQQPKEKPEQYGFIVGSLSVICGNLEDAQEQLKKELTNKPVPFYEGFIFKVIKTITKKTTYEID